MSAFKDQLARDMSTFINPDEFASEHTINDVPVIVIEDNDELMQRSDKSGIDMGEILIFVTVDEWKKTLLPPPIIDMDLLYDGKYSFVRSWNLDDGMYEITLTQNRSG